MSDADRLGDEPLPRTWDLNGLLPADSTWGATFERYEARVEDFDASEIDVTDPTALAAALTTRDELRELGARLEIAAECRSWVDVTDETATSRSRRITSCNSIRESAFEALIDDITGHDHSTIESMIEAEPALEEYAHVIEDAFRQRQYALTPAGETVMGELSDVLAAPGRLLRTVEEHSFDPPTVSGPDGSERTITSRAFSAAMRHPDRAYRKRAYEAYRHALEADCEIRTQAYREHVNAHVREADLRGYESTLAMALDGLISPDAIHGLVDGVRETDAFDGRLEALQTRQGYDDLHPWDLSAPISDGQPAIPYEEAAGLAIEAVAPLGEAYQQRLSAFLSKPRVHVAPEPDKREIPAAMFGRDGSEPFVFLNYEADLESLYFFVHELGHVMHYLLAKEAQPPVYRRLSWQVGELSSFLHEILLTEHLLAHTDYSETAVLDAFLRKFPLPAAARGVAFVSRVVVTVRESDNLTTEDCRELHYHLQSAFRPSVSFESADGHLWMNHALEREPYHPYFYVVGSVCALAVAAELRKGTIAHEDIRNFLAAGDSAYPLDLLEDLGLNIGSGEVVQTAAGEYERLVGHL